MVHHHIGVCSLLQNYSVFVADFESRIQSTAFVRCRQKKVVRRVAYVVYCRGRYIDSFEAYATRKDANTLTFLGRE